MRTRWMAAFVCVGVVPFVVAAGGKPLAAPAKPAVTATTTAASSTTTATATGTVVPAPSGSSAYLSPLTPRPDEAPPVMASASTKPGVTYDEVMAEIAALRARVALVANAVWKSKLAVSIRLRGSHAQTASVKLLLDGAVVWSAPKGFSADDDTQIFDGGVAPGLHALAIEVERRDDRNDTFRTVDRTTATVMVPQGKRLEVGARLEDGSDMGDDFPDDQEGEYDLRVKIEAKAK